MKQGYRFFNLLIPFKTYEELKALSAKTEKPVAEIVRQGIDIMLINSSCKSSKEKKNE
ncbi:MAG: ribbon-helix-helix domain-containing protein [Candidatus Brocadia sp.]|nr:ribbon-helix-helix domain-containing protein [Candidatus Brocadia sp.]